MDAYTEQFVNRMSTVAIATLSTFNLYSFEPAFVDVNGKVERDQEGSIVSNGVVT